MQVVIHKRGAAHRRSHPIADLDDFHDRLETAWRSWREGLQRQET
jgi:hypothetical protein